MRGATGSIETDLCECVCQRKQVREIDELVRREQGTPNQVKKHCVIDILGPFDWHSTEVGLMGLPGLSPGWAWIWNI